MNVVFTGMVLLQVFTSVLGFPNGAPTKVCGSMEPNHTNTQPQSGPSPYTISTSNTTFQTGQPITVIIKGSDYGGILLQARSGSKTDALGNWDNPPANTKYLQCSQNSKGAITHSNTEMKNNLTVYTWIPPNASDSIYFVATVAQNKMIYWLDVRSANLTRVGGGSVAGSGAEMVATPGLLLLTLLISTALQR